VLDGSGFVRRSRMFAGNVAEGGTLKAAILNMRFICFPRFSGQIFERILVALPQFLLRIGSQRIEEDALWMGIVKSV
ncbi:hypothetical protein JKG47_24040, partial [Acidithiobacillus sp. MC6.1]|nr:hypothetical protein [Acidithiobacillus sp. MC6.1]